MWSGNWIELAVLDVQNGPKYFRLKLGEVIWPGTHDSGAYCQEFDYSKVVHHDTLRKVGTHLLYCLGPAASGVASKWSQTQSLSIKEQLEHGARYLDLRISRCLEDGCYYIVHSFCGPNIEEVFRQISEFMSPTRMFAARSRSCEPCGLRGAPYVV